jgi:hypothetical protein
MRDQTSRSELLSIQWPLSSCLFAPLVETWIHWWKCLYLSILIWATPLHLHSCKQCNTNCVFVFLTIISASRTTSSKEIPSRLSTSSSMLTVPRMSSSTQPSISYAMHMDALIWDLSMGSSITLTWTKVGHWPPLSQGPMCVRLVSIIHSLPRSLPFW